MKNKVHIILILLLIAAVGFIVWQNFISGNNDLPNNNGDTVEQQEGKQLYTCGMHPEIISDEPGNCPICEMKLTPIKNDGDDSGSSEGIVKIDPVMQQNMNLKSVPIERRDFSISITTNGMFAVDERSEHIITSKVNGWVEKLFVNYTGMQVIRGKKLLSLYSPELVAAQQELKSALKYRQSVADASNEMLREGGDLLVENALRKLELLDMAEVDIQKLVDGGDVQKYITLYAPASGMVMEKNVKEGEKISAGMPLMHIANLNRLWIIADIYESELAAVTVGDEAIITVDAYPGEIFNGKISFVYPTLDNTTRTAKVRIDIHNSSGRLKPDMLASVTINGKDYGFAPAIPEHSVIRTGERDIAIVSLGDGKFKPVEVELGVYSSDGYYQLLGGLEEGDVVVTSAQFLIDSESNLKTAVDMFGSGGESHTGHQHEEPETEEPENEYGIESPLIRTGVIDVEALDLNSDGMLYECPMDWNIIDDEPGRCPACEMKLKEYSIADTKKNLEKYGYEYKK